MSLKKSAQKNHLESEYEQYRTQAEAARSEDHYEKAARYYEQCVDTLEQWAELESNEKLKCERLELAENLKTVAKKVEIKKVLTIVFPFIKSDPFPPIFTLLVNK